MKQLEQMIEMKLLNEMSEMIKIGRESERSLTLIAVYDLLKENCVSEELCQKVLKLKDVHLTIKDVL